MTKKLIKRLKKEFSVREYKRYTQITIPLVINTSGTLLVLRIKEREDGYTIYCPTNIFLEANAQGNQTYYFNIFEKYDKNYHYDIKIKKGKIYKDYLEDRSIITAIDEFIRFYIMLDDFIINNSVIGAENKFE